MASHQCSPLPRADLDFGGKALTIKPVTRHNTIIVVGVAGLLTMLLLQLALSVRLESQTWDEGDHIFAGYRSKLQWIPMLKEKLATVSNARAE